MNKGIGCLYVRKYVSGGSGRSIVHQGNRNKVPISIYIQQRYETAYVDYAAEFYKDHPRLRQLCARLCLKISKRIELWI